MFGAAVYASGVYRQPHHRGYTVHYQDTSQTMPPPGTFLIKVANELITFFVHVHKLAPLANKHATFCYVRAGGRAGSGLANGGAPLKAEVSRALAAVVSRSSLRQGAKGILTAGVLKSASYSIAKVTQAIAGRRKRREEDVPPRE